MADHPLHNEWWHARHGAGDPEDTLRCDTCGGFLSFEHHDDWHHIYVWNKWRFDCAREGRIADYEASERRNLPAETVLDPNPRMV